jgi:alpha/beta superfamily hydrolase
MLNRRIHLNDNDKSSTAMLRSFSFGSWRAVVALVTIFAFVSILLTATTHSHATSAEDQACSVCSVAIHKIADTHLVDLPNMVAVLFFYAEFVSESRAIAHVTTLYLPPACGPPRSSQTIL